MMPKVIFQQQTTAILRTSEMQLAKPVPMNRIAIKIRPALEKHVKRGHPWIFAEAITKQSKEGNAGDVAIIFDNRYNKAIGVGLLDPHSPIRIKLLENQPATIDNDWFKSKIDTAFAKRAALRSDTNDSYRLIHGENDGLPGFVADVYGEVVVVKLYALIWLPYIDFLFAYLLEVTENETLVLRLSRNVQKETDLLGGLADGQILHGALPSESVVFTEHGVQFYANVVQGHKTGFFLDHRANRHKVGQLAADKTVLDIFSYAGGFAVHALVGGARKVTSVDISAQALELAKANAQLNDVAGSLECIAQDAFEVMSQFAKQGKKFDIVIVDPPSFAKRDAEIPKALHAYDRLAKLAIPLVAKGGILFLASCSSRVSNDEFFAATTGALRHSGIRFQELERTFHDDDHPIGFPEGTYLKSGYFKISH